MRMWEIREGYSHKEKGQSDYKMGYEDGYEEGYADAMKEAKGSEMGERGYRNYRNSEMGERSYGNRYPEMGERRRY